MSTLLMQIAAEVAVVCLQWRGIFLSDLPAGPELLNLLVAYPVCMAVIAVALARSPRPAIARTPPSSLRAVGQTCVAAVGMLEIGSAIARVLLTGTDTWDYTSEMIAREPLWQALVFTVVLAPVMEELLFRKLLLERLLYLGDWSALLLSSLFFGLFHTNLYQFFYALLAGLVLGYVHIMTGQMRWNILLHGSINLVFGVLVGYLPEDGAFAALCGGAVAACVLYTPILLLTQRPWRQFYPGPMDWFRPGDKVRACLSSGGFWACVCVHLGLSLWFIQQR